MTASAAQVFGPTVVDPGFTTTGEKTLLTMATTLPAGGKNVIIVALVRNGAISTGAAGTLRIYKGDLLLYESNFEVFNSTSVRARHALVIAVDSNPAGNDTYSFRMNITDVGATTGTVHVQGIVIKADDAVWAENRNVSAAGGATVTVVSISTTFPAGSKVAIIANLHGQTVSGSYVIGAGNIRIKAGATIVSSNQFAIGGSGPAAEAVWVNLSYLDVPAAATQTYSVEVYNNTAGVFTLSAAIVAFTVSDGAFLDTASVALTSGTQVTVGNLATTLSGSVVAIGLAAAENTGTRDVTAFLTNDVVLQLNNSATGQVANGVSWFLERRTYPGRSGILPLFRVDAGVVGPSYQVKMTARVGGLNGEAKILAFRLAPPPAETITARSYPMYYLATPPKATELVSKVSGATVTRVTRDYPEILIKSGKARELRSRFTG
jgi:hypothetical protein